jgi:hypothetical protein
MKQEIVELISELKKNALIYQKTGDRLGELACNETEKAERLCIASKAFSYDSLALENRHIAERLERILQIN